MTLVERVTDGGMVNCETQRERDGESGGPLRGLLSQYHPGQLTWNQHLLL